MPRWPLIGCLAAALLGAGCDRLTKGEEDERHEANFLNAINLQTQGRDDEALKAFNRALEANPQSASAHREIGQLCLDKKRDYALAVFHLRRHQQIKASRSSKTTKDPGDYAVEQQIKQAQILLAAEFTDQIGQQQNQSKIDELKRRNAELETTVIRLNQQIALRGAPVVVANPAPPPPSPQVQTQAAAVPVKDLAPGPVAAAAPAAVVRPTDTKTGSPAPKPASRAPAARTHVVKAGEVPAAIARRYGISVQELMAVNKGIDPRRMRVGQTVNLPEKVR
jgi:LysM repeat protein